MTLEQRDAYQAYISLTDQMRQKNRIQTSHKAIAFSILGLSLLCLRYLLGNSASIDAFMPKAIAIYLASFIALGVVWFLDMVVVERTIGHIVMRAVALEKANSWIPRFFLTVNKMHDFPGYVKLKTSFYIGCFFIQLFTFFAIAAQYYLTAHTPKSTALLIVGGIAFAFVLLLFLDCVVHYKSPYNQRQYYIPKGESTDAAEANHSDFTGSFYNNLSVFRFQYDKISATYRQMALVWALGMVFAMLMFQVGMFQFLGLSKVWGFIIFFVIGCMGVTILWHQDVMIYHRFWCAVHIQEKEMEQRHPFLPRIDSLGCYRTLFKHWNIYLIKIIALFLMSSLLSIGSLVSYKSFLLAITLYAGLLALFATWMIRAHSKVKMLLLNELK